MESNDPANPLWHAAAQVVFAAESPVGKAVLDRELRYLCINETLAAFNGRSVEAHLGRTVAEVLPDAYPAVAPLLKGVVERGESHRNFRVSVEVPDAPGALSEWEASYLPIPLPDGSIGGVYVQAVNLTAKLKAERALEDSEKQLRRVLDSLFAFVGVMTPEGILVEANRAPLEAAGIQASDVLGKPFWDTYWWSYSTAVQDWLRNACSRAAHGEVVREDVTVRMVGDSRMTLDFMIVPMRGDDGRITHLIPSAIDISDRVAVQRRIEAALRERTVLLQEVHHRVKNNLQIIASLLRLQSRTSPHEARRALQDSQDRVMAMSLTHQLLYERSDVSALQLGSYLKRLVGTLREAHGAALAQVTIHTDAPDDGLAIDLQQAVPVALVVNELLTNAMKHAFVGRDQGKVRVTACDDGHGIAVTVADDGVGLPEGFRPGDASSLGFNLVGLLAEQLGATVTWPQPGRPGAAFTLRLPLGAPPR